MRTRRWLLLAMLVAGSTIVATPLAAESFLASYKSGLEAVEERQWEAAGDLFRLAISGRSAEKNRLPLLRYFQPYVPHFYLGVALRAVDDCDAALAEWRISTRQGVVEKRELLLAQMREGIRHCEAYVAQVAARVEEVDDAIDRATRAATAVDGLRSEAVMANTWQEADPSLARRREAVAELLARARRLRMDDTPRDRLARLDEARRLAFESVASSQLLYDDTLALQQQLIAAGAELGERRESLDELKRKGLELLRQISYLRPFPPLLNRRREELQSVLADSGKLGDEAGPEALEALAEKLSSALARLRAASAPPSTRLVSALSAFVEGANEEVVELLGEYEARDSRERFHAHLLLAAARLNLYLIDSTREDDLRMATADVLAAREADDSITPSARIFSPRFVRFFDRISLASTPSGG